MARRLRIWLCLLAAVSLVALPAFAAVQNVKVGGDLTFIGLMREFDPRKSNQTSIDEAIASIVRLRVDADLTDNVSTTIRLLNERYWGDQNRASSYSAYQDNGDTSIDLDLAYVTLREFLYSPATLRIGRQELRFGNAMIVGDPDTNNAVTNDSAFSGVGDNADLSARKAFDAIRLTLDYNPLILDIIAAKINERIINAEDDTDLYGINANYTLNDKTILEGYWFQRHVERRGTGLLNKDDQTDVLGARIATSLKDDLKFGLEAAYQLGRAVLSATDTAKRRAYAFETYLTYEMPNVIYTPTLTGIYAYFTGQKGNRAKTLRAWDPMFEDQTWGYIANAIFNQSNLHAFSLIGTLKPADDISLKGEYWAFWWDKQFGRGQTISTVRGDSVIMAHKKFAGQEIDLTLTYDYTEDVQFSLLSGVLIPGESLDKRNRNTLTQVLGKMTVTF
jgi:hypothetical protein